VKCHKRKEIMDLSDLATALAETSLAAILLTDVNRAEALYASGCAISSYEALASWISTFSISPAQIPHARHRG
jgi:hypothetical protein